VAAAAAAATAAIDGDGSDATHGSDGDRLLTM
jgi:hypothetical protein